MAAAPPQPPQQPFARAYARILATAPDPAFLATAQRDLLVQPLAAVSFNLRAYEFFDLPVPGAVPISCSDRVMIMACALEKHDYVVPLPSQNKAAWRIREKLMVVGTAVQNHAIATFPIVLFSFDGNDWVSRPLSPADHVNRADGWFIAAFMPGPGMQRSHATMGRGIRSQASYALRTAVWESPLPPPLTTMHWRNSTKYFSSDIHLGRSCECPGPLKCQHEIGTSIQFMVPLRDGCYNAVLRNFNPFGHGLCALVAAPCGYALRVPAPTGLHTLPVETTSLMHSQSNLGVPRVADTINTPHSDFLLVNYPRSLTMWERLQLAFRPYSRPKFSRFSKFCFTLSAYADLTSSIFPYRIADTTSLSAAELLRELTTAVTCRCVLSVLVCKFTAFLWRGFWRYWCARHTAGLDTVVSNFDLLSAQPIPGVNPNLVSYSEWRNRVSAMGINRDPGAVKDCWRRVVQANHEVPKVNTDPATLELMWQLAASVPLAANPPARVVLGPTKVVPGCQSPFHDLLTFPDGNGGKVKHFWCKVCKRYMMRNISVVTDMISRRNHVVDNPFFLHPPALS